MTVFVYVLDAAGELEAMDLFCLLVISADSIKGNRVDCDIELKKPADPLLFLLATGLRIFISASISVVFPCKNRFPDEDAPAFSALEIISLP